MTDYLWPAVALAVAVLAYRLLMTLLSRDSSAVAQLRADHAVHVAAFSTVCTEWRHKVLELEAKCDRVVVDAKNEIAGDLATVQNITGKGWR
jgi:hypothetical protein